MYGFKISELLAQLELWILTKPRHPPTHISLPPNAPKERFAASALDLLPESIKKLCSPQSGGHYQQKSTSATVIDQKKSIPPAPPDHSFYPDITVCEDVDGEFTLNLFQRDVLSSQFLGVKNQPSKNSEPILPAVKKMSVGYGEKSLTYFADLKDLQRKLYTGVSWMSASSQTSLHDHTVIRHDQREDLEAFHKKGPKRSNTEKFAHCSPPLINSNHLYCTKFSAK
ncbi:uncharacterized protein LOC108412152 [Pygocentrus nattereri]|uniref:uncharacterized protein LOC108412152 n=1 Tax=Pygocentrus nattereri TaxID=42514 RepID=UPI0008145461|nr:uncharacterized protein LOC108412152 [Pygocentrus nattereri]